MPQRNVTITPHQDEFVEAILTRGQYGNVSEVFRAALRLLEREEQARLMNQNAIRRSINKGIDDIEAGRYTEVNSSSELAEFFAGIREERKLQSKD